jgi:uncharacterized membrane protein (UPF0136 family)
MRQPRRYSQVLDEAMRDLPLDNRCRYNPAMKFTAMLLVVYGIFVLCGGAYGYVKSQSMPSLISGVVSAALAFIAAVLYAHHPRLSLGIGAAVGFVLDLVMVIRFLRTRKPMPALAVAAISSGLFIYCLFGIAHILNHRAA